METRVECVQAKCRQYTNRGQSMYRYLTVRNVSSYNAQKIWNCKMPLEVNIFLWQALHDKIQSAAEEKGKNNWQWGEFCALCGKLVTVNHICFIASQHSSSLASKKSNLDANPRSLEDIIPDWIFHKLGVTSLWGQFSFAEVFWAILHIRNKTGLTSSLTNLYMHFYSFLANLEWWKLLLEGYSKEIPK